MNKKQTRGVGFSRGGRGGGGGGNDRGGRGGGGGNGRGGRRGGGNGRGAGAFRPNRQAPRQQQQQSPRKEYGMLNRSKVIRKRGPRPTMSVSKVQFSTGKGGAKVSTFRRRRPLNKIAANRALNRLVFK
jgi:hypothetical protein